MAHLVRALVYIFEAMFFLGIAGCACVIVLSWINIFAEGFRDDPAPKTIEQK